MKIKVIQKEKFNILRLWLYPSKAPLMPITKREEEYANELKIKKAYQYKHSRGYIRSSLSKIFNIDPLKIPLFAPPRGIPKLSSKLGHISISHCRDSLLIGWSIKNIGVDIERSDRSFPPKQLSKRFFSKEDNKYLDKFDKNIYREKVLEQWVVKESATKWQESKC